MAHSKIALPLFALLGVLFVLTDPAAAQDRRQRDMLRMFPIMVALDKDGNGELSAEEIAAAPESLKTLDKDGNGKLTADEIMPDFGGFGRGGRGGPPGGPGRQGGRRGGRFSIPEGTPRLEPADLKLEDGAASVPDRVLFKKLAYQGPDVLIDTHLAGVEYVKFQVEKADTDEAQIYFINTKTHRAHMMFMRAAGLPRAQGQMRGVLVYRPLLRSPSGKPGLYTFEFEPNDAYSFDMVKVSYDLLGEYSPILKGNLAYNLLPRSRQQYLKEVDKYDAAKLPVFEPEDVFTDIAYLPLNLKESYGRLRLMSLEERPGPRDIVIYKSLPNEMPRVAGIITGVRQTPLSHVNLRAVQDQVPNAYIRGVSQNAAITALIGKYVHYRVSEDGYEIREASVDDVEQHFAALRPSTPLVPERDLSVTEIRPSSAIDFGDSSSFGAKTTNLATLGTFDLGDGLVPDGQGVPFHYYQQFMAHNGLFERVKAMRGAPGFATDTDQRIAALAALRKEIEEAEMPAALASALEQVQASYPEGTGLRCRSSTNNEDLPGFSGAGLYDSFTHRPEEGHLAQSVQQVFASLWNFRAYEEREFYRVDHLATAMGVLIHPNYSKEQANGVAVTKDILYQTEQQGAINYYLNAQVGEDLVTNPKEESVPEEILLSRRSARYDQRVQDSNRTRGSGRVLSKAHLDELREALPVIHNRFWELYGKPSNKTFAMEVEFKVTAAGQLSIKQARPWVFSGAQPVSRPAARSVRAARL